MKTIEYTQFGGIENLHEAEIARPTVKPDQVLVQVKAVSLNPLDWKIRKGEMKLMSGSHFPKHTGVDFAGIVVEVGDHVSTQQAGDAVFGAVNGMKEGALAEFVAVSPQSVWKKPASLTYAQAASIPVVGAGAYEAMIAIAEVGLGSEVLLNGATGGMGMFALQLAKQRGAIVTAVTSGEGLAFAKRWGADTVLDYRTDDVLTGSKQYDVVFDLSGKLPFEQARAIMKPHSVFINPVPKPVEIISTAITNLFAGQKDKVLLSNPNDKAMQHLIEAVAGGLQIEVNKTFGFAQFADAYRYTERGGYVGKVVIEVA